MQPRGGRYPQGFRQLWNVCGGSAADERKFEHADQVADLYNNAPCGYHSLDLDGVFVQINETELKWLGFTREEFVGKIRLTDILTPDSVKLFLENYQNFKETGSISNFELEFVRKDGTVLPVLLNANAVRDYGRFVMSRSIIVDISDFKRATQ